MYPSRRLGQEGAEPPVTRRRPWNAPPVLERVRKSPPAYGARNGQKVGDGTGEVLLGPGVTREGGRQAGGGPQEATRPPVRVTAVGHGGLGPGLELAAATARPTG